MDRQELIEASGRPEAFLEPLLAVMGRSGRRRWGAFYVQTLLLEGGRKTAAGIAARYGGDIQALQQFVNQNPWDWLVVRQRLAQQMMLHASPRGPGLWLTLVFRKRAGIRWEWRGNIRELWGK